mgnify:CR=1 FL=1|jgi:hypothetical protein
MSLKQIVSDTLRLLTFRISRETMLNFDRRHLIFGLILTWLVGIGRYWDNPRAEFLQHLGIGSVIYIFLLAILLAITIAPLAKNEWSYFTILTFIALVSPPAVIYAIPVQFYFDLETSNIINAWFLFVVAVWRLALLVFFLRRFMLFSYGEAFVVAFLPVTLLIFVLTLLNLEKAVFNIMGGFEPNTPNDEAFTVLISISFLSFLLFPFLLVVYLTMVWHNNRRNRNNSIS